MMLRLRYPCTTQMRYSTGLQGPMTVKPCMEISARQTQGCCCTGLVLLFDTFLGCMYHAAAARRQAAGSCAAGTCRCGWPPAAHLGPHRRLPRSCLHAGATAHSHAVRKEDSAAIRSITRNLNVVGCLNSFWKYVFKHGGLASMPNASKKLSSSN